MDFQADRRLSSAQFMKFMDYFIIAALLLCLAAVWVGFRVEGGLAGALVLTVAGWRFYDRRRKLPKGACGDDVPDLPGSYATGADLSDANDAD